MSLVAEIEAIYANGGPPPRTAVVVGERFRVSGLALECLGCGMKVPQSRTRQAPEARRLWLEMHLDCGGT